jgi:uncharacterized membrane protein
MSKEAMGAFIDAVYAIAITILALEAPAELENQVAISEFVAVVFEYAIAFMILFAFWVQHRRLNRIPKEVSRSALWVHAVVLLTVCLIPRATSLVFHYGGVGKLLAVERELASGGMSRETLVDVFYCVMIFAADASLLALMLLVHKEPEEHPDPLLRDSKIVTTGLLLVGLAAAAATSVQNRYFGIILPIALLFEVELAKFVFRRGARAPA